MLNAELIETLHKLATFLAPTEDPWWVLGSAAVALKGYDPGHVRDVDVLVSVEDAKRLMARWSVRNRIDGGTDLYRSSYFLLPDLGAVRVEIMAGYQIKQGGHWQHVRPTSREAIELDVAEIFVPSDVELIGFFEQLDRDKDKLRIAAMKPF
ncbi:MAG: hypothetical protein AAFZ91_14330 [Pseudomonadota bacterium]